MNVYCPLSSRRMLADSRLEARRRLAFTQSYTVGPVCGVTACYTLTCQIHPMPRIASLKSRPCAAAFSEELLCRRCPQNILPLTKRSTQKYGACGKHARFANCGAWTNKTASWVRRRQLCRPDATGYSVHFDIYLDGSPVGAHGVASDAKRQEQIVPASWPQDTLEEHNVPEIEVRVPTCGQVTI
jgi:hypothetical protein